MEQKHLLTVFFLISAVAFTLCAAAVQRNWIGEGDLEHPFSDPQNWRTWSGGKWVYAVPEPGDEILINDCGADILVDDDSAAIASSMVNYLAYGTNSIVWCATTNCTLKARISKGGNKVSGGLVKRNPDTELTLAADYKNAFDYSGCLHVEEGLLRLPSYVGKTRPTQDFVIGPTVVKEGATLVMVNADSEKAYSDFCHLECYGTLTNENPTLQHTLYLRTDAWTDPDDPTRMAWNDAAHPSILAGVIGPRIRYEPYGCADIVGENNFFPAFNPMTSSGQVCQNVVGIKKFGKRGDPTSSIGTQGNLKYTWDGVVFKYLGDGETTDKTFDFQLHANHPGWTHNRPSGFDGGPHGGAIFTGKWNTSSTYLQCLLLTGSNTTPCEVSCDIMHNVNKETEVKVTNELGEVINKLCYATNYSFHVFKRGTGTWRFNDGSSRVNDYYGSGLCGGFSIEEGTLQTESLTERGETCALGTSAYLFGGYYGVYDESKAVDWSFSFGQTNATGEAVKEGTLEHVGSQVAVSSRRKCVLIGNARIKSSGTERMHMNDFSALTPGEKTLALDGANTQSNVVTGVCDGNGIVSVAKDGSGLWILRGNQTFSGDLSVNGGTLLVEAPTNRFTWFRFTMRHVLTISQIAEIALFDKDGNRFGTGLNLPSWYVGGNTCEDNGRRYLALEPGEVCSGKSGPFLQYSGNNSMKGMFDNTATVGGCIYNNMRTPSEYRMHQWLPITFRLPDDAPEAAKYDICRHDPAGIERNPWSFMMEGSRDGATWELLHETDGLVAALPDKLHWYSDNSEFQAGVAPTGYAINGNPPVSSLQNIRYVSVAKNATLKTECDNVGKIGALRVDASAGCGTIDGFAFKDSANLDVVNMPEEGATVPITLENVTGFTTAKWSLTINGEVNPKYALGVSNHGFVVVKRGTALVIR